jgi:hypothetical protein
VWNNAQFLFFSRFPWPLITMLTFPFPIFTATSGWSTTWNIDNVKAHLTEFESWGTRAVGTPGSAKSIDYLRGKLAALPCTVRIT